MIIVEYISIYKPKMGTDKIYVYTKLPSPFPKVDDAPLVLQFDVERNMGESYVLTHFPDVSYRVIHEGKPNDN